MITSQPHLKGEAAVPLQIDAYMAGKGFERLAPGTYYYADAEILVHDLHPRNAVVTPDGKVRAIDPAIMRGTAAMAESIRRMAAEPNETGSEQRDVSPAG